MNPQPKSDNTKTTAYSAMSWRCRSERSRKRFGVEIRPDVPRPLIVGTDQFAQPQAKVLAVFHSDAVFCAELMIEEFMHWDMSVIQARSV